MSLELGTFKGTIKNNDMSIKQIADNIFGVEAMIGWLSSGLLIIVNLAINSKAIDLITAWMSTAFAIATGFFAMLKMRENYLQAKARRKITEEVLEDKINEEVNNEENNQD